MKFFVAIRNHAATLEFHFDGKGGFSGSIDSDEFGTGKVAGAETPGHLNGSASLDGHNVRFDATYDDKNISGRITAGWFLREDFHGTAIP